MAAAMDIDFPEGTDEDTIHRIRDLERLLENERNKLASRCVIGDKPKKPLAKPPPFEALEEQNTFERAQEIVDEEADTRPDIVEVSTPPSKASPKKEEKKERKKKEKKEKAMAELEKLRQENAELEKLRKENEEHDKILKKLEAEIERNKAERAEKKEKLRVEEKKVNAETLRLQQEIEKQKQMARQISAQQQRVGQLLHKMNKVRHVQICFVTNIRNKSAEETFQKVYCNAQLIAYYLRQMFSKLQLEFGFVFASGYASAQKLDFDYQEASIKWCKHSEYKCDFDSVLKETPHLKWNRDSFNILYFLVDYYQTPTKTKAKLEEAFKDKGLRRVIVSTEKLLTKHAQDGWKSIMPVATFIRQHINKENIVSTIQTLLESFLWSEENQVFRDMAYGTNPCQIPYRDPRQCTVRQQGVLRYMTVRKNPPSSRHYYLTRDDIESNIFQEQKTFEILRSSTPYENDSVWSKYQCYHNDQVFTLKCFHTNDLSHDKNMIGSILESMSTAKFLGNIFNEMIPTKESLFFDEKNSFESNDAVFLIEPIERGERFFRFDSIEPLTAFSHWTHHVTNGLLLVEIIEASKTERGYHVNEVAVHCKEVLSYAMSNLSNSGVDKFFARHSCNAICGNLRLRRHPKQEKEPVREVEPKVVESKGYFSSIGSKIKNAVWSDDQNGKDPKPCELASLANDRRTDYDVRRKEYSSNDYSNDKHLLPNPSPLFAKSSPAASPVAKHNSERKLPLLVTAGGKSGSDLGEPKAPGLLESSRRDCQSKTDSERQMSPERRDSGRKKVDKTECISLLDKRQGRHSSPSKSPERKGHQPRKINEAHEDPIVETRKSPERGADPLNIGKDDKLLAGKQNKRSDRSRSPDKRNAVLKHANKNDHASMLSSRPKNSSQLQESVPEGYCDCRPKDSQLKMLLTTKPTKDGSMFPEGDEDESEKRY